MMSDQYVVVKTGEVAKEAVSSSPYALYGSDNHKSMITSVLLDGDNYNEWSTEMLNALQAKIKTGFINGSIMKPSSDDPNYENRKTINSMIIGWIRASIEPKVRSTVTFITNLYQLWTDLKQRFSVGNKIRVHQIRLNLPRVDKMEKLLWITMGDYVLFGKNYKSINLFLCARVALVKRFQKKKKKRRFINF